MLAERFLKSYWDGTLPVPIEELAKHAGVHITIDNNLGQIASFSKVGTRTHLTIRPMKNSGLRFLIAHVVGHIIHGHILDHELYTEVQANFSQNTLGLEADANRFAAEVLMPGQMLNYLIGVKGVKSIDLLAKQFNVSSVAMKHQLASLRLI